MKYSIVILAILYLLTNCNDNNVINKISDKTRDSTLLILQELYSKQNYKEAEKIIDKLPPRDEFDTKYFNIKSKIKYNCKVHRSYLFC